MSTPGAAPQGAWALCESQGPCWDPICPSHLCDRRQVLLTFPSLGYLKYKERTIIVPTSGPLRRAKEMTGVKEMAGQKSVRHSEVLALQAPGPTKMSPRAPMSTHTCTHTHMKTQRGGRGGRGKRKRRRRRKNVYKAKSPGLNR